MVDPDSKTLTFWQANATRDIMLVRVGKDCSRSSESLNGTNINDTADADDSGPSYLVPTASAEAVAISNTGAIVGIAIGAASGAGFIAGVIAIFILRHRRQKVCSSSESAATLTGSSPESNRRFPMWHEQPGDSVQELSALRVYQYELSVREWLLEFLEVPRITVRSSYQRCKLRGISQLCCTQAVAEGQRHANSVRV